MFCYTPGGIKHTTVDASRCDDPYTPAATAAYASPLFLTCRLWLKKIGRQHRTQQPVAMACPLPIILAVTVLR